MASAVHGIAAFVPVRHRQPARPAVWLAFLGLLAALLPALAAAAAPSGVRTLYLVRHGLYDQDDPRDADLGKALVPLGREQAALAGARLAALPVKFAALHTSTMTRARETAEIIGAALQLAPQPSTDLRECTPPTRRADIMAKLRPGEGDSCTAQIERAFAHYFTPSPDADTSEILVCHGNVIRYFVARALGLDPALWLRMTIANCSLTMIRVRADGTMQLVAFGDMGHLPPRVQTFPGQRMAADSVRRR
jgi:serine/threonine-protein phosphatase PGAM5